MTPFRINAPIHVHGAWFPKIHSKECSWGEGEIESERMRLSAEMCSRPIHIHLTLK